LVLRIDRAQRAEAVPWLASWQGPLKRSLYDISSVSSEKPMRILTKSGRTQESAEHQHAASNKLRISVPQRIDREPPRLGEKAPRFGMAKPLVV